jgi:hypothetical protein
MKTRDDRKRELYRIADTHDGYDVIYNLWKECKSIPEGSGMVGVLVRREMIPDILRHEYPNG